MVEVEAMNVEAGMEAIHSLALPHPWLSPRSSVARGAGGLEPVCKVFKIASFWCF